MPSLSEVLSQPCYLDPCIYHFVMPSRAVAVMYVYLKLNYSNPIRAIAVAQSYMRKIVDDAKRNPDVFPNRYADMWPTFVELIERIYLVHGTFNVIRLLYQYVEEYLQRSSISVHRLFYTHTHNVLVELGRVSDTSQVYATVRIMKPLCSAIRYVGKPRDTGDVPWEDIWLVNGYQYNAHVHNYQAVIEAAARTLQCELTTSTLSEFIP